MSKPCKVCSSIENSMFCSKCKTVNYCSKECQSVDWTEHKNTCKSNELSKKYEGLFHIITSIETNKERIEFDNEDTVSENDKRILSNTVLPIFKSMVKKYNTFPNIAYGEYITINDKDVGYIRVVSSFLDKKNNEHFNTFEVKMFKNENDYKKSPTDFNNNGLGGLEDFYNLIIKDYEIKLEISINSETNKINIKPISTSEPEKKNLGLSIITYIFQNFMTQIDNAIDEEVIKFEFLKPLSKINFYDLIMEGYNDTKNNKKKLDELFNSKVNK